MAINLLPKEISNKTKKSNQGKTLTYMSYAFVVVAIGVLIGGAVLVSMQQRKIEGLKQEQLNLLAEAERFQQQEKQLVIVKDRATVAQEIISTRANEKIESLHKVLFDSMPEGVTIYQQDIALDTNEYTVVADSILSLRNFIKDISQKQEFSSIVLGQLIYNEQLGYQAALQVF